MKKESIERLLFNIGNAESELYNAWSKLERSRMPKKIVDKSFELYAEAEAFRIELNQRLKNK